MSIAMHCAPITPISDEHQETLLSNTAHSLTLWFVSIDNLLYTLLLFCVENPWYFTVP